MYTVIRPPFPLVFRERHVEELKEYNEWFHAIMPERIAMLAKAVKRVRKFKSWKPDETVSSLDTLGAWFEGQVETRPHTPAELEELDRMFPGGYEKWGVDDWTLTNRTFSLAIDIGMYFGRVFLKNVSSTWWTQVLKDRRNADFGQPVIMGLGPVPLNPIDVATVTAYRIAKGQSAQLRELYEIWLKKAPS